MSEKKLLREWYPIDVKPALVKESREANGGKIILSGIIQKADTKNQNGRIYPESVLRREVDNYMKAVRENRAFGELDHPESSTVSLKNVSHVIREIWWEGKDVFGRVEILNTSAGKILEGILESGGVPGISSRGVGSTNKKEGADVVSEDYQIICWDIVSEPSTPGAFLYSEGKSIDFDPKKSFSKADRIFRALNEITRK
jgi:hypothetical protein